MKPLVLLVLIAFFPYLQQVEREEADLLVVKFSWAKEKQKGSSVIRGAQNPGGTIVTPVPAEDRDLTSRRSDLRIMDKKAVLSAEKPVEQYQFRLELKNTGASVVRGLIWEYQPTAKPDDYQPKQYLCALQVNPQQKNILEIWTPYLPLKLTSADERKDATKDGTVIINQIAYSDGSVWKKRGWHYKLPSDSLGKLAEGTCSIF